MGERTSSVTRSFWCEIATPLVENRHKIATQKFLKIATFLGKIPTFASHSVEEWHPCLFYCIFMQQFFWKMWHFREFFFKKSIIESKLLFFATNSPKICNFKKNMVFSALKKSPLEKKWSPLDPKNRHGGDKSPHLVTLSITPHC